MKFFMGMGGFGDRETGPDPSRESADNLLDLAPCKIRVIDR